VVRLYETGSFRLIRELAVKKQNPIADGGYPALCFSHDGKLLAFGAANQNTINLWNVATGEMRVISAGQVYTLDFTSDDRFLVCNQYRQNSVNLMDIGTGFPVATLVDFISGDSLVYTGDGYFAATDGAAAYVTFRMGDKEYSYEEWAAGHYNPTLVSDRIKAVRLSNR
jgi:WD40 repeat protein